MVPLYFLAGSMGFVGLVVLCWIFSVVCPYPRIRTFWLRYLGNKKAEVECYRAKLQEQRTDIT